MKSLLVVALVVLGLVSGIPAKAGGLPISTPSVARLLAAQNPDSMNADTTKVFVPGNWDSVMAAYDQSFKVDRQRRVRPKFGLR